MNDLVVVGGGPAGAACALWAHQLGMRVLLLEAGPAVGGLQLRSPYENRWLPGLQGRTGQEVAAQLHAHLEAAAVPFTVDFNVVSIRRRAEEGCWEIAGDRVTHLARHVVIATGSRPRRGGFLETDRIGIGPGMPMERLEVAGRRLAILGGGDNAFDMAVFALRRGAGHVDIYCRREPRAQRILRDAFPGHQVHVGAFLADPSRMTVNGTSYDYFGVQFGFEACIPGGLQLPLHDGGVQVDRCGAVHGIPGLFAAGEVTNYWHPCVATSYAHGVQVATSIQAELAAVARATARSSSELRSGRSLAFVV